LANKNIHLVAYYSIKPKDPKRTKEAGYITNPENFDYDESINITRGLKIKDELNARVILDLTNQTVKKNTFNDSKDFPSLLAHYQEGYPKYINPLLAQLYPEETNVNVDVLSQEEKEGS
jgi:hypothetical protein